MRLNNIGLAAAGAILAFVGLVAWGGGAEAADAPSPAVESRVEAQDTSYCWGDSSGFWGCRVVFYNTLRNGYGQLVYSSCADTYRTRIYNGSNFVSEQWWIDRSGCYAADFDRDRPAAQAVALFDRPVDTRVEAQDVACYFGMCAGGPCSDPRLRRC